MSAELRPTPDPDKGETEESSWAKWVLVVIVGEASLITFVIVLSSIVKTSDPVAFVGAFVLAILIGGRVAGVRGAVEWVVAAVLGVAVAMVLLYLFIGAVVSQMTGP